MKAIRLAGGFCVLKRLRRIICHETKNLLYIVRLKRLKE